MKSGVRVRLVSFDGKRTRHVGTPPNEDYWKLVGASGTTVESEEERRHFPIRGRKARVCDQFDPDLAELGLEAHNRVKNSLWIRCSDLSLDADEKPA